MYELVTTSQFDRRLRKFVRSHSDLRQRLAQVFRDLERDPFQPYLRLHPLRGPLEGLHAVRVTHSYRLIILLEPAERRITLLDIDGHDEVYR